MLKISIISKWKLFIYENVCPVHLKRQPDLHTSAEDLKFSDSVPTEHGGPILLVSSIMHWEKQRKKCMEKDAWFHFPSRNLSFLFCMLVFL